jgi:hypothetical protein
MGSCEQQLLLLQWFSCLCLLLLLLLLLLTADIYTYIPVAYNKLDLVTHNKLCPQRGRNPLFKQAKNMHFWAYLQHCMYAVFTISDTIFSLYFLTCSAFSSCKALALLFSFFLFFINKFNF